MATVILVDDDGDDVAVSNTRDFISLVYGRGWMPKTGSIEANLAILYGATVALGDPVYERYISRTGKTAGMVPVLQGDGSLRLETGGLKGVETSLADYNAGPKTPGTIYFITS